MLQGMLLLLHNSDSQQWPLWLAHDGCIYNFQITVLEYSLQHEHM